MNKKIKRLLKWAKGGHSNPLSIEISPTLRCNLNCLFCWRYGKKVNYGQELAIKEYKKIIKEAKELDVNEIRVIGGGEPLFRKDAFQIMKKIKSKGIFGYICTNGTLLNKKMIKKLVKMQWDHVKISLHGSNKETHDFLVNKEGAFDRVLENIGFFKEFKEKLDSEKPYLEFGVVLVNKNYKELPKIVELASQLDIQAVFVEPVTVYTEKGKELKLTRQEEIEFKKIARKSEDLAANKGIDNNFSDFIDTNIIEKTGKMKEILSKSSGGFLSAPCYKPWSRMGIRVDGKVCPCGFFDENTKENVKEKSLKDIWFGEYFENLRKQFIKGNLPPHCEKCCVTLAKENKIIRNRLKSIMS